MIGIETERRWILRYVPTAPLPDYTLFIEQHYNPDGWRYRRQEKIFPASTAGHNEPVFFKTRKTPVSKGANHEEEYRIGAEEYHAGKDTSMKSIAKTRSIYNRGGLKYEVDAFRDITLVIMEVELSSLAQHFDMPGFLKELILFEVTDIKVLGNSAMAR